MQETVLTDIKIPFWRLVLILVKVAVAAIPAAIIVTILYAVIFAAVVGLLGLSLPMPMRPF